jgi:chemotaxis protein methyltransferase WspC
MSRAALLDLLARRIGLDAGSLGAAVIEQAFADARADYGVDDDDTLHQRVLAVGTDTLVEHFVVPESWFFRGKEQIADLAGAARGLLRERRPLRILSLPCAGGEEAYTIAIGLLEAGLAPDEFDILGIDLSPAAVRRARGARYRMHALRGAAPPPLWAVAHDDGFELTSQVRRSVSFRTGNALDPDCIAPYERFDAIFCRNLLIYLTADARARVLARLLAALDAPGLLMAGHAELLSSLDPRLTPLRGGSPFTYLWPATAPHARSVALTSTSQRAADQMRAAGDAPVTTAAPVRSMRTDAPTTPAASPMAATGDPEPAAPSKSGTDEIAVEARRLADRGEIDTARGLLMALPAPALSAELLFLLGVIEAARGEFGAADDAFVRATYLDPNHVDAVQHRRLLAMRRGDAVLAVELDGRLARLSARREKP